MSYTRQELVNIFAYNYERIGLVESIYKLMSHLRSISLLSGSDKKAMIIEVILQYVESELENFIDDTIEFLYDTIIAKQKKSFFTCIR